MFFFFFFLRLHQNTLHCTFRLTVSLLFLFLARDRDSLLVLHLGTGLLFVAASVCLCGCQAKSECEFQGCTLQNTLCHRQHCFSVFPLILSLSDSLTISQTGKTIIYLFVYLLHHVIQVLFCRTVIPSEAYALIAYLLLHHNSVYCACTFVLKLSATTFVTEMQTENRNRKQSKGTGQTLNVSHTTQLDLQ